MTENSNESHPEAHNYKYRIGVPSEKTSPYSQASSSPQENTSPTPEKSHTSGRSSAPLDAPTQQWKIPTSWSSAPPLSSHHTPTENSTRYYPITKERKKSRRRLISDNKSATAPAPSSIEEPRTSPETPVAPSTTTEDTTITAQLPDTPAPVHTDTSPPQTTPTTNDSLFTSSGEKTPPVSEPTPPVRLTPSPTAHTEPKPPQTEHHLFSGFPRNFLKKPVPQEDPTDNLRALSEQEVAWNPPPVDDEITDTIPVIPTPPPTDSRPVTNPDDATDTVPLLRYTDFPQTTPRGEDPTDTLPYLPEEPYPHSLVSSTPPGTTAAPTSHDIFSSSPTGAAKNTSVSNSLTEETQEPDISSPSSDTPSPQHSQASASTAPQISGKKIIESILFLLSSVMVFFAFLQIWEWEGSRFFTIMLAAICSLVGAFIIHGFINSKKPIFAVFSFVWSSLMIFGPLLTFMIINNFSLF